ncbi:MAG: hypothetical protein IPM82_13765 [Saprospiraceae bacterium]|nr:hypothetical protein [Saprospiraceae bacterium]
MSIDFDIESYDGAESRFIGFLKCGNQKCNEFVAVAGKAISERQFYVSGPEPFTEEEDVYYPIYINPPLHIIEVRKEFPENIRKDLIDSFGLYWIDFDSCGNRIRTIIELLLNIYKIPRKIKNKKNKFGPISLHKD